MAVDDDSGSWPLRWSTVLPAVLSASVSGPFALLVKQLLNEMTPPMTISCTTNSCLRSSSRYVVCFCS